LISGTELEFIYTLFQDVGAPDSTYIDEEQPEKHWLVEYLPPLRLESEERRRLPYFRLFAEDILST
jgi:hypothetical protein